MTALVDDYNFDRRGLPTGWNGAAFDALDSQRVAARPEMFNAAAGTDDVTVAGHRHANLDSDKDLPARGRSR